MPANYPNWNPQNTPKTDKNAKIKRYRKVQSVVAIEVINATYRDSLPITGFFELVNPRKDPRPLWGSLRAEVYSAWHGVKPPNSFPKIEIGTGYKIHQNYSGDVIDNIA